MVVIARQNILKRRKRKMRKHPNGTLIYPHRGKPPICPEGYETDPADEYM